MEPAARRAFPPAEAGALLIVVTARRDRREHARSAGSPASSKAGLIVGVVLGVPAGIGGVYVRYRGAFS